MLQESDLLRVVAAFIDQILFTLTSISDIALLLSGAKKAHKVRYNTLNLLIFDYNIIVYKNART